MTADAVRLLLFPALMAFAASSDLFTMTISNRVALIHASLIAIATLAVEVPVAPTVTTISLPFMVRVAVSPAAHVLATVMVLICLTSCALPIQVLTAI